MLYTIFYIKQPGKSKNNIKIIKKIVSNINYRGFDGKKYEFKPLKRNIKYSICIYWRTNDKSDCLGRQGMFLFLWTLNKSSRQCPQKDG